MQYAASTRLPQRKRVGKHLLHALGQRPAVQQGPACEVPDDQHATLVPLLQTHVLIPVQGGQALEILQVTSLDEALPDVAAHAMLQAQGV